MTGERHFTATGFVVWRGQVLLHWHRKERLWLPMGGHVEENEDPVQCVLREVEEEAGFKVELFGYRPLRGWSTVREIPAPVTIQVEDIKGSGPLHQHIDMIYFCRPSSPPPAGLPDSTMRWVDVAELEADLSVAPDAQTAPTRIPEDVRVLALDALARSECGRE